MTTLQTLTASQASKEVPVNENFDSLSALAIFGRRHPDVSGLTWAYYGGPWPVDGEITQLVDDTVALTDNATNFVELGQDGTVSVVTSTRSAGKAPLYQIVTSGGVITSVIDERSMPLFARLAQGRAIRAMANANQTLTQDEAMCAVLEATGANTGVRDLIVPLVKRQWTVFANTTSNGIRVIGATGTGVTIAVGKRCIVECDGTNVSRVTADNP